jgi:hypothetical protein
MASQDKAAPIGALVTARGLPRRKRGNWGRRPTRSVPTPPPFAEMWMCVCT